MTAKLKGKLGHLAIAEIEPTLWVGYDPLTMDVVYFRPDGPGTACSLHSEHVAERLSASGVLRDIPDSDLLARLHHSYEECSGVFALYMNLTDYCNYRCSYCSFFAHLPSDYEPSIMTAETAGRHLEIFHVLSKTARTPRYIVFYGGEPFTNKEVLLRTLEAVRTRDWGAGGQPECLAITNGSLVDDEVIAAVAQQDFGFIVSIDGPPEVHNRYRKDAHGGPTYHAAAEACDRVNRHGGILLGLSLTLGSHNAASIGDVVAFLHDRFQPASLGLSPLHIDPTGSVGPWDISYEDAAEAMIEAFCVSRDLGLYIEQVMRRIRPFVKMTPRAVDCPSCGGMIRAYPSGQFGPCGHFVVAGQYRASVNERGKALDELLSRWRQRTAFCLDWRDCEGCIARGICGGGCPLSAYKCTGSIRGADLRTCVQARKILLWLLTDLWSILEKKGARAAIAQTGWVVPTPVDRTMLLGRINLDAPRPLKAYSSYGEVHVDRSVGRSPQEGMSHERNQKIRIHREPGHDTDPD